VNSDNGGGAPGRAADITATLLLLALHAFLLMATLALLSLLVMVTDPCGSRRCGDPAWIDRAMWLGLGGGGAVFLVALAIAVIRLAGRKTAFFVPLIGSTAQIGLAIGAAAMGSMAGPV
jgi:hypothetical protein